MAFQIGDEVIIHNDCSGAVAGMIYKVESHEGKLWIAYDRYKGCNCQHKWLRVNKPQVEEKPEFRVGDLVKVINEGKQYTTYSSKALDMGAKNFKDYCEIKNGCIGAISSIDEYYILFRDENSGCDILIGRDGLEKVEEPALSDLVENSTTCMNYSGIISSNLMDSNCYATASNLTLGKFEEMYNSMMVDSIIIDELSNQKNMDCTSSSIKKSRFKVGDRILNIDDGLFRSSNAGKKGTVWKINHAGTTLEEVCIKYDDGCSGESLDPEKYYKIITKKSIMSRLNVFMKKLLDADTQSLVKAGYLNEDLTLTSDGEEALTFISFTANKAALVEEANKLIAEREAACKK